MIRPSAGLFVLSLVALLSLINSLPPARASQPFSPVLEVSLSNPNPSANSNVTTTISLSPGSHPLGSWAIDLPLSWEVAKDTQIPYGNTVAEGTMSVDVDCNSTVDNFGFLLSNEPADPLAVGEWQGQITSWWPFTITVDGSSAQGFDMSADLTNFTEFHALCAPQTVTLTIFGRSSPGDVVVLTNPSTTGTYTWTSPLVSLGAEHTTQITDTVCVCPAPDTDGDGVIDEANCGSDPADPSERPERIDDAFAGVDDDGDTLVDEALPAGSGNYDCDGDGYTGTAENHVYSPSIRGDQDPCGSNASPPQVPPSPIGFPADLIGGPFSANKVDMQDLVSFVAPVYYLNTNVGTNPGDVRWDVVPGSTFGAAINVQDMISLTTVTPPMLASARAFGGPLCPWPPVDGDGDGVVYEFNCGSDPVDPNKRPERIDGAFAGVSDDGDVLIDEPLPPGSAPFDCDGDGWRGDQESLIYNVAPSTTKDQDPCGVDGRPADLTGSDNALNIADLNSFLSPPRANDGHGTFNKFNHPLDDTAPMGIDTAMARWNLQLPPHLLTTQINIADLNSLLWGAEGSPARPPMLFGQLAFFTNGGQCPFPP